MVSESFGYLWTEVLKTCPGLFIQRIEQLLKIVASFVLAPFSDLIRLEGEFDCKQCEKCAGKTHRPCPEEKPNLLGSVSHTWIFFSYCLRVLLHLLHGGLPQVFGCFGYIPCKLAGPIKDGAHPALRAVIAVQRSP